MTDKLVKQLEKAVESQDEAKTANLIERILVAESHNAFALHCKAVLCIHQGKFDVALGILDQLVHVEASYNSDEEFLFQRGYCFYRLQKFSEAKEVLAGLTTIPAQHLLAQIAYNMEDFQSAAEIYEKLLESNAARDEQERQEIITNLSAAYVTIDAKKAADAVRKADEKTSDMLFNAATAELENRQYDQAMDTLAKAEQLVARQHKSSNSIEHFAKLDVLPAKGPDRALFEELSPMWLQRAYLHYAKGEEDLSAGILAPILRHNSNSAAVNAVASINWAAIKRHNDFFDTYRKLKHVQTPVMMRKLATKQKLLVRYNTAMLLLNIGKLTNCKQVAESLLEEHPDSDLGPLLLLAATVRADKSGSKQKKTSRVDDLLASISSKANVKSAQTRFTIAQIRLEQGNISGCLEELSQIEGIDQRIGFVLTATEWLIRSGDYDGAVALATSSMAKSKFEKVILTNVGRSLIRVGANVQAAALLSAAPAKLRDDGELLALRVIALARSDITAAIQISKALPPSASPSLPDDVLMASVPTRAAVEAAGYKRTGGQEEEEAVREKKQRIRVMRRPAKIIGKDNRPDPERWLPIPIRPTMKDMPERRKKELKRIRGSEQADKRKAAEKRKAAAAVAAAAAASPSDE
jgi:signal recognition particle subunit SRP72